MKLSILAVFVLLLFYGESRACYFDLRDKAQQCAASGIPNLKITNCRPIGDTSPYPDEAFVYVSCDWPWYAGGPTCGLDMGLMAYRVCDNTDPTQAQDKKALNCTYNANGSIVRVENRSVTEVIPLAGLTYNLTYTSDRVRGRKDWSKIKIPVSNANGMNPYLDSFDVSISIAGTTQTTTYPPAQNIQHEFVWNGLDSNNNILNRSENATITVAANYDLGPCLVGSLSIPGSYQYDLIPVTSSACDLMFSNPVSSNATLGSIFMNVQGIGGWNLSIHHQYDTERQLLFLGDGSQYNTGERSLPSGNHIIVSRSRDEIYEFDSSFKHIRTLDAITGKDIYVFGYTGNRLASISDKYGNTTSINYDTSGNPESIVSPFGFSTALTVNSNGFLTSVTNPLSHAYTMTYLSNGLLSTFEDPKGVVSTFSYDADGYLVSDTNSEGNELYLAVSEDGGEKIFDQTSATGRLIRHRMTVSSTNYSRSDQYPDYSNHYYTHDTQTKNWSVSSPGISLSYNTQPDQRFYADFRAPYSFSRSDSFASMNGTFSESVNLSNISDPFSFTTITQSWTMNGKTSSMIYNKTLDTITMQSPMGKELKRTLNSLGDVSSVQLGNLTPVDFTFDSNGRVTLVSQGSGRQVLLSYSSTNGLLTSLTNPLNQTVQFAYNSNGQIVSEQLADGRTISYSYDPVGNLTQITPPGRSAHVLEYNGQGYMTSYQPPLISAGENVTTTYEYSVDRELTKVTRPDSTEAILNYHQTTGNLTSINLATGNRSYTFGDGKVTQSISEDFVTKNFYWFGTKVLSDSTSIGSQAFSLNYSINNDFLISSETLAAGIYNDSITYSYDNDDFLISAGTEALTRASDSGAVTQLSLGSVSQFFTYSSGYGELEELEAKFSSTPLYKETITRDDVGRISTKTIQYGSNSPMTIGYAYDSVGRLIEILVNNSTVRSYLYDLNSNRTQLSSPGSLINATYDGQDRLITYDTKTYSYNLNGEIVSVSDSSSSTTIDLEYDFFGNLKSVVLPTKTVSYGVDAHNLRVFKKVDGSLVEYYVWNSSNQLVGVIDGSGQLLARYVYGSKSHSPDYMIKGSDRFQIISNHLGSPVIVVNSSTGVVEQEIEYDEFGNILSDTNPGFTPFGFAGCLYDQDTKLCKFGARDYDASIGRWLSKDPILFAGGDTNLYGYVLQDPINFIDTNGMSPEDVARMQQVFNQSVARMDQMGVRRPGEGYLNGALNNIGSTLGCGYWGCGQQANYVVEQLTNSGISKKFDDYWTFSVVNVTPFHQRAEARSSNPKDPVVSLDPWSNKFSTQSCK